MMTLAAREELKESFCLSGAENEDGSLSLREIVSVVPEMQFLRSLPLLFYFDSDRSGKITFEKFFAIMEEYERHREMVMDANVLGEQTSPTEESHQPGFSNPERPNGDNGTSSDSDSSDDHGERSNENENAEKHDQKNEDDVDEGHAFKRQESGQSARTDEMCFREMSSESSEVSDHQLTCDDDSSSGPNAADAANLKGRSMNKTLCKVIYSRRDIFNSLNSPSATSQSTDDQATSKSTEEGGPEVHFEVTDSSDEEVTGKVLAALRETMIHRLNSFLEEDGCREEFMRWLWKATDVDSKGHAGPHELSLLVSSLETDEIELPIFFYQSDAAPDTLAQGILNEFDTDGAGCLHSDEFMVLADLITRAFEHWESSRMDYIGDYILGRALGNGSSGIVRIAVHSKTKQKFAVKIVQKGNCAYMSKLDQEIGVLTLLQGHNNVVRLEEALEDDHNIILVMELCGGGSLLDLARLYPDEQVPEDVARTYMKALFDVLMHCSSQGICHRDVRLENMLLDNSAQLKLSDFGQAGRFSGSWDVFGTTLVGSIYSLSPEQVSGSCYSGQKIDVWSAGVSLYCFLVGYPPFYYEDVTDMLTAISTGTFHIPSHVSAEAADLLRQMIQVDSEKRPTFQELLDHPWIQKGETKAPELTSFNIPLHDFYIKRPDLAEMIIAGAMHEFNIHFHLTNENANLSNDVRWILRCYSPDYNLKFFVFLKIMTQGLQDSSDERENRNGNEEEPGSFLGPRRSSLHDPSNDDTFAKVKQELKNFPGKRHLYLPSHTRKDAIGTANSLGSGSSLAQAKPGASNYSNASDVEERAEVLIEFREGEAGMFLKICRKFKSICDQKLTDAAEAHIARQRNRLERQRRRKAGAQVEA